MSAIIIPDEHNQQLQALGDDSVGNRSRDEEMILGSDSGEVRVTLGLSPSPS